MSVGWMLLATYFASGLLVGARIVERINFLGMDFVLRMRELDRDEEYTEEDKELIEKLMIPFVLLWSMLFGVPSIILNYLKK